MYGLKGRRRGKPGGVEGPRVETGGLTLCAQGPLLLLGWLSVEHAPGIGAAELMLRVVLHLGLMTLGREDVVVLFHPMVLAKYVFRM